MLKMGIVLLLVAVIGLVVVWKATKKVERKIETITKKE